MFLAEMLVCGLLSGADCILIQDKRGPYYTQQECIERLEEMVGHMVKVVPQFDLKAVRCNRIEGDTI
mgnify:CR=1 FL=1